jgi:hypothetical protein
MSDIVSVHTRRSDPVAAALEMSLDLAELTGRRITQLGAIVNGRFVMPTFEGDVPRGAAAASRNSFQYTSPPDDQIADGSALAIETEIALDIDFINYVRERFHADADLAAGPLLGMLLTDEAIQRSAVESYLAAAADAGSAEARVLLDRAANSERDLTPYGADRGDIWSGVLKEVKATLRSIYGFAE